MDECPVCGKWTVDFSIRGHFKKCYSCSYNEWYCPEKWLLEHDALPGLIGEKNDITGRCHNDDYMDDGTGRYMVNVMRCMDCICMPKDKHDKLIALLVSIWL